MSRQAFVPNNAVRRDADLYREFLRALVAGDIRPTRLIDRRNGRGELEFDFEAAAQGRGPQRGPRA
jgi:hypothetical protein